MRPIRFDADALRGMRDEQLLDLLGGGGDDAGTVYPAAAQAIAAELLRRQFERSRRPHWSVIPSFWLLVASVLVALAGLALTVVALPRPQPDAPAAPAPAVAPPGASAPTVAR